MEDTVLHKAKSRLDALEREAADLRMFIEMYVKLSEPNSDMSCLRKIDENHSVVRHAYYIDSFAIENAYSSRDQIVSAAREVLKHAYPKPLSIAELFRVLSESGIKISGQNPKGNLSAKLAAPDDIVYVRDEGWYYRPKREEAPDHESRQDQSEASRFPEPAKGREAVPGGGP
jgi:hypothetical protein